MEYSFQVLGLAELDERLRVLPEAVRGQVLTQALLSAAEPIVTEARNRAPIRTDGKVKKIGKGARGRLPGFLRASVRRARGGVKDTTATVQIGPAKAAFYGMFSEFGTSKQSARPWLRPAFEIAADAAVELLREKLAAGITRRLDRVLKQARGR